MFLYELVFLDEQLTRNTHEIRGKLHFLYDLTCTALNPSPVALTTDNSKASFTVVSACKLNSFVVVVTYLLITYYVCITDVKFFTWSL